MLREDFYYRTETLAALADRYGLTGQFMTDTVEIATRPPERPALRG